VKGKVFVRSYRYVILFLLFVLFAVPARVSCLAADAPLKASPSAVSPSANPQDGAKGPAIPISIYQPIFSQGISLGGDVDCTKDGILRFKNKQLQLCVGGEWRIVTLQPR
jgi:hypothetical protein